MRKKEESLIFTLSHFVNSAESNRKEGNGRSRKHELKSIVEWKKEVFALALTCHHIALTTFFTFHKTEKKRGVKGFIGKWPR